MQRPPVDGDEKYGGTQRHSPPKLNRHDHCQSLHILGALSPDQPAFEAAFATTQIFYADQLYARVWACGQGFTVPDRGFYPYGALFLFRQFQSNRLAFGRPHCQGAGFQFPA